jgi:MFS family permease
MERGAEPGYPRGPYAIWLVGVLFLAWVVAFLDRQIVTLLLPSLKADLQVSDTQVSLIQGMAFASIYAVAGLPLGWVADRASRRNLLIAGIAFWSLATMACGLATSFGQLFVARMAVGLGEACLAPACVSLMADSFPKDRRGRAMGLMQAGTPVGSAASLFLGGMLLSWLAKDPPAWLPHGWAPWKVVFLAIGLPGLVVALLVATLREPPRRGVGAPTVARTVDGGLWALLASRPLTYGLFFGTFSAVFILGYGVSSWAPTVLMRIYGLAPREAGAIFAVMLLACSASAGVASGFLSDALTRRRPGDGRVLIPLVGLPLTLAALLAFVLARDVTLVVATLAAALFGMNFVAVSSYPALQDLVPGALRGRVVALLLMVGNLLGLGCGPTLVALVTDRVFGDEMALQASVGAVGLGACALGLVLAVALRGRYAAAMSSEARSAIMMVGAAVLPEVRVGMIEASATRRPETP